MKYLIPCLLLFSLPFFSFSQCPSACDVSFSLTKNSACDSTDILIQNTSTTPLGSIASFKWDFGDGHVETGDSINNTDFWLGAGGDYKIPYTYTSNGSFDITLYVTDSTGCNDSYKIKEAAWNVVIDTEISSFFTSPWEVCFIHAPTAGASAWIWNFGDPPSGPVNTNNEEWQVCHSYSPGAYMISLRPSWKQSNIYWRLIESKRFDK
jgi:PKD repeat protein